MKPTIPQVLGLGAVLFFTAACRLAAQTVQFHPTPGAYFSTQTVTLTTGVPGGVIRYTVDGSDPGPSTGFVYSGPLTVTSVLRLRAAVFVGGVQVQNGSVASARYTVLPAAASAPRPTDRGRVRVVAVPDPRGDTGLEGHPLAGLPMKVLRTDADTPLRGASPWIIRSHQMTPDDVPPSFVRMMAAQGLNSMRLVWFDAWQQQSYPGTEPNLDDPGVRQLVLDILERWIDLASEERLYVCINFHSAFQKVLDMNYARKFWNLAAPYFRDRTHVFYELTNEPVNSASNLFLNGNLELNKQVELHLLARSAAPETFLLQFSSAQVDGTNASNPAEMGVNIAARAFAERVLAQSGTPVDWSRTGIGYHVYFSGAGGTPFVRLLHREFPAFFTEVGYAQDMGFGTLEYGPPLDGFRVPTEAAERLGIGWWQWTTDTEARFSQTFPALLDDALAKGWNWLADPPPPGGTAPPAFTELGGPRTQPVAVGITCPTPGAVIRYTTDGTDPDPAASPVYTGSPILVSTTTELRAIAVAPGLAPSVITPVRYVFPGPVHAWRVNAGGFLAGNFANDHGFAGGTTGTSAVAVSVTGVPDAAPAVVYGSHRTGPSGFAYVSPPLVPGSYTVRVHLADPHATAPGQRVFRISVNGALTGPSYLGHVDVFALAGGSNRAAVATFVGVMPGTNGSIRIDLLPGTAGQPIASAVEVFAQQVDTPAFSPPGGTYTAPQAVSLTTTTAGATIRYTTDGSTPGAANGTIYTGSPISVSGDTTLRAVGLLDGWIPSLVASATYTFLPTTSLMRINAGGPATGSFSGDVGFDAGFTSNWGTPTISTSGVSGAAPAAVYRTERWHGSAFTFTSAPLVAGLTYTVRLHFCEHYVGAPGARVFHVSVNGARSGPLYIANLDVYALAGTNRRAVVRNVTGVAPGPDGRITVTFLPGPADNPMVSGIEILPPAAATPTATPGGGTFTSAPLHVVLTTSTPGATIRYRTDGVNPTSTSGTVYTGPIVIDRTTNIRALATAPNLLPSSVRNVTYTISPAAPTVSPAGGPFDPPLAVTLATASSGAIIRYTLDGSQPSWSTGLLYTGPIELVEPATLRAAAAYNPETVSPVASAPFTHTPWGAWKAAHFTPSDLRDPAVSGPDAAPAGDRWPNLLKFAVGLAPFAPTAWTSGPAAPGRPPSTSLALVDGVPHLEVAFTALRDPDSAGIIYIAEFEGAPPLAAPAAGILAERTPVDATWELLRFRDPIPATAPRFARIRIGLRPSSP